MKPPELNTQRFVLQNGMTLLCARHDAAPVLAVRAFVDAGQRFEASPGVSAMTGRVLGAGAGARSETELCEAIEFQGGTLETSGVLWCYLRNTGFKKDGIDYHLAADLTSQANHLGVTIEADIIKQKQAENNGGFKAINFAKTHEAVYSSLTSDHPIDLTRYQVAGCYMGRIGLINSGGASGTNDFADAAKTAVINKRAGGTGLISGRKAFQRPMKEGVKLLNTIQDVYLDKEITVA